jgi:hypothetical protein
VAAVNLLVTDRAVLVARRIQVVECRRHYAYYAARRVIAWQVGVAFETYEAHLLPRQHARIGGTVRLVASSATFKSDGCVLECEWTALITVAIETARLVGGEILLHRGADGTVRIVAIHATHGVFGQLMVIRLLELRPDIQMATGALGVDGRVAMGHESHRTVGMNLVTCGASHLVLGMAVLQTPHLRGGVEMAAHANLVGRGRGHFRGLADVRRRCRFGVFLRRAVAGFAGSAGKAAVLIGIHLGVRALLERVEDVFVAGAARVGSGEGRRGRSWGGRRSRGLPRWWRRGLLGGE